MPTIEPPTTISIKIKVPPGSLPPTNTASTTPDPEQFSLGLVSTDTTVGSLRNIIQQLITTHPTPERQRILYAGRALVDNDQSIADALNIKRDPSQTDYVIHLLVKGEGGVSRTPTPNSMTDGGHTRTGSTPAESGGGWPRPPTVANAAGNQIPLPLELQRQQLEQLRARTRQMGMQAFPAGLPPLPGMTGHQHAPTQMNASVNQHAQGAQSNGTQAETSDPTANMNPPMHPNQPGHPPNPALGGQGFHVEGVGPDGQRFFIHQQTVNYPPMHAPGMLPHGVPMPIPPHPMMQMPFPSPMHLPPSGAERQANGPSALDRARENMAEMRRILDELANRADGTWGEAERRQVDDVRTRARNVNEYVDPLHLHNVGAQGTQRWGG